MNAGIRENIVAEYKRRYPDWRDIRVTDIVDDYFGKHLAVVHANNGEEEICFFDPKNGVRIFSTTEELAQSLKEQARVQILDNWRRLINFGIAVVSLSGVSLLLAAIWAYRFDSEFSGFVAQHFPAIIGIPFSFLSAFIVVALFRQGESMLDFNAFGMKMRGATGEILLWLLCFVAISGSISLLWKN